MPTHTLYDHAARLAVLEARGVVSPEEAVAQFREGCTELAVRLDQDPARSYGVLLDTRRSDTVPTPTNILRVLDEICANSCAGLPLRWAILAAEPVHYGMGRL